MHNKLRRAIELEQRTTYGEPHEKISAQSKLLTRALVALGGPVDSERPPEVTMASLPVVTSEKVPVDVVGLVNPNANEATIIEGVVIGNDPGDETYCP